MSKSDAAELAKLGVPAEQLAAELAKPAPAEPELVLAAHLWTAVELFAAMRTQWDTAGTPMGVRRTGLRYDRVRAVAREMRIKLPRRLKVFKHLRILEDEWLVMDAEHFSAALGGGRV